MQQSGSGIAGQQMLASMAHTTHMSQKGHPRTKKHRTKSSHNHTICKEGHQTAQAQDVVWAALDRPEAARSGQRAIMKTTLSHAPLQYIPLHIPTHMHTDIHLCVHLYVDLRIDLHTPPHPHLPGYNPLYVT